MNNQTYEVLMMLREGSITQFDAHRREILSLTRRIRDLREKGYEIHREMITDKTHYGGKVPFGKWTLIKEPNP
jgi:hypothetical protein